MPVNPQPQSHGRSGPSLSEPSEVQVSLWDLSASQLVEQVASTGSTPGGGSVAIMAACMGAALLKKAVAVSHRKKQTTEDSSRELEAMLEELNKWDRILRQYTDQDSSAFNSYVHVLGLPHDHPAEAEIREKSIEEALVPTIATPIAAAVVINDIVSLALGGLPRIHDVILSDAVAGLRLLNTSAVCLLTTAESNLPGMVKSPVHAALSNRLRELRRATRNAESDLEHRLHNRALARSLSGGSNMQ